MCLLKFSTECPRVNTTINNGKVHSSQKRPGYFLSEDIVTFSCGSKYGLSSSDDSILCKPDGSWDGDDIAPKCYPRMLV